ncbi:MAG: PIG-L family deacetylase [Chthoniobacterales bacterium]|nr:PIG-L family deacetylase [Chthoniobacterales bacterium]
MLENEVMGMGLRLSKEEAEVIQPEGLPLEEAFASVTHLAIGAHPDDVEIVGYVGIRECFRQCNKGFAGVVCTNGAGGIRAGITEGIGDEQMVRIRRDEQRKAAVVGEYRVLIQLGYGSEEIRDRRNLLPDHDLKAILRVLRPRVLYTHNPADKHPTHVAVFARVLAAVRGLPTELRPKEMYGCEVWRDLDWMPDEEKVIFRLEGEDRLFSALLGVYESQLSGGKRYDVACRGRWAAHATFHDPYSPDASAAVALAMDLMPLIQDDSMSAVEFVLRKIDRFRESVRANLEGYVEGQILS